MKSKRLKLCVLLLSGIGITGLQAQTEVPATGGNASGSGGSASYTAGQVAYQTYTGINGSATVGIQQPYEIFVISGIDNAKGINLSISTYPNPTTDHFTLEVKDIDLSAIDYQLLDLQGKILQSKKITGNKTAINMKNLKPSIYFLKINLDRTKNITCKIIKN